MTNLSNMLPLAQMDGAVKSAGDGVAGATKGVSNFIAGITDSMAPMLGENVPKIIGAVVILVIGYIIAKIIKWIVSAVVKKTGAGKKMAPYLGGSAGKKGGDGLASGLGTGAFWVVMMFVAIACLNALNLDSVSEPLTGLLNKFFAFIPNIIGAGITFAVAWLIATVVKVGSASALEAGDVDNRLKLQPGTLTNTLPMAAFSLILLMILPAVLETLGIDSLTGPVKSLVEQIMNFLPSLICAGLILTIFCFVAKLAGTLVSNLLSGTGFNEMPQKMGLVSDNSALPASPSDLAGKATFGIIGILGATQAVSILKLDTLSAFINEAKDFAIPIVIGCAILGVGLWLGNMAKKAILASNMENSATMSNVAFGGIMVLTGVIALKRMGLAGETVDLGFGLALGGVALAAALAFGLGGRDAAARYLEKKVK